jgi:murein L,D-transpeptidase YcbB/YkuD
MPTGQVSDSLLQELNVPAQERLQQILVNMNRALWLPTQTDSSRIVVNIPSQELVVYNDTSKVMTMPVIVGKEGSGTMAFNDRITTVVFNPYWNIPKSIVQSEIMPAMKKDPNYLKSKNMEIVRQNDSIPEIRQLPGKDNSLGLVKFLFPNSFDIYLHDTPNKMLFAQQNRALSHGCIRVAEPDSLAHYVLRGQADWTPEKIAAAMSNGKEQQVTVKNPVPVSITYYTAWASANGKLQFRKDIYGYDAKTTDRMFTQTSQPVTTASPV